MSGKEVVRKLRALGWEIERQSGSQVFLKKDGKTCPVPIHANKDLAIGTLKNIERITGEKLR